MPAPRFITSESQLGAPGVYVEENAPPVPTRGQRNRIIALAGQAVRGPVDKPVVCVNFGRFLDVFGGRDHFTNGGALVNDLWKALQGKRWGKLIIVRAAAAAADTAEDTLASATPTDIATLAASSPGIWGNGLGYRIINATNGDAGMFNLILQYGGRTRTYENLDATADNFNTILGDDDANWATLTKIASGRPANTAGNDFVLLTGGTDGVIADTDYTATGRAMEKIDSYAGVNACAVVGRSTSDVKDKAEELAAATAQKVWYICPDDEDVTYTDAITERGTRTGGRLSYWFNHVKLRDGVTRTEMLEEPFLPVLSILSQTDPDIHPGDFDNTPLMAYARGVVNELGPTVRDALDAAGVSFIHRDQDAAGNEVVIPGNALTCDLAINNRDLDGRYMKDFILDAVAKRLQGDMFKGNTNSNRAARASSVSSFLDNLARSDRYIMRDEQGKPLYTYTNNQSVNTLDENATGLQREVLIARLIPKNKQILLQAVVGVDATISEQ